jgi:hypothetical protein
LNKLSSLRKLKAQQCNGTLGWNIWRFSNVRILCGVVWAVILLWGVGLVELDDGLIELFKSILYCLSDQVGEVFQLVN